jgi:hypothetical protein
MAVNKVLPITQRTPAQLVFIHTLESVGISGLVTAFFAIVQFIGLHGFDVHGLLEVLGASFVTCMSLIYKTLSGNPQVFQALADTQAQLTELFQQQQQQQAPIAHVDVPTLAVHLKDELMKVSQPPQAQGQQQPGVSDMATRPQPVAVRTNTTTGQRGG